jgi:hypothetical protein
MRYFLLVAVAVTSGCTGEDTRRLGVISRRLVEHARGLTPANGLPPAPVQQLAAQLPTPDELSLDARVIARLRWERRLSGATIAVRVDAGMVTLSGTVRTAEQRTLAIQTTEATLGVEHVVDELTLG